MYTDNVTLVRRLVDCYQRLDGDALEPLLHLDAKYSGPGVDFGVDVVGRYPVIEHYKRDVFSAHTRVVLEIVRVWEDRDRAVVVVEWQGRFWPKDAPAFPDSGVLVAELQDDLIFWIREYSGARRGTTAAGEA